MVDKKAQHAIEAMGGMDNSDYGLTAFALTMAILNKLEDKKLISGDDIREIFAEAADGLKSGQQPQMNPIKFLDAVAKSRKDAK